MNAGYSPDAVSYTTLITALSRLGRSSDAVEAFKALDASPNAQADLYAYSAVINALSVAGRMTDAKTYLQSAGQLAQDQEVAAPVEAFGAVIKVRHCTAIHYCRRKSKEQNKVYAVRGACVPRSSLRRIFV